MHSTILAQGKLIVSDGPYIDFSPDKGYTLTWIEKNKLKQKSLTEIKNQPFENLPLDLTIEGKAAYDSIFHFDNVSKIAAISDIHGQYDVMMKLFSENGIIDKFNHWSFDEGHLVITGDIFDRGDHVTEILWYIYELEKQATEAGGKVHMLLGNHEVMILNGDNRYIHKKYRYTSALTKKLYSKLFDENSVLGDWLRSKPVVVSINDIVFLHAGFSQQLIDKNISIDLINKTYHDELIDMSVDAIMEDDRLSEIYFENGPLWYRGYVDRESFNAKAAESILNKLDKKHIVVGHTSMQSIVSLYDERIFMIDSSIKFGKTGEVLLWEDDQFFRGTMLGETISITPYKLPE